MKRITLVVFAAVASIALFSCDNTAKLAEMKAKMMHEADSASTAQLGALRASFKTECDSRFTASVNDQVAKLAAAATMLTTAKGGKKPTPPPVKKPEVKVTPPPPPTPVSTKSYTPPPPKPDEHHRGGDAPIKVEDQKSRGTGAVDEKTGKVDVVKQKSRGGQTPK